MAKTGLYLVSIDWDGEWSIKWGSRRSYRSAAVFIFKTLYVEVNRKWQSVEFTTELECVRSSGHVKDNSDCFVKLAIESRLQLNVKVQKSHTPIVKSGKEELGCQEILNFDWEVSRC